MRRRRGERQAEIAGVAAVEHAESIAARGHVEVRSRREIHQHLVAVPAEQQVLGGRRVAVRRIGAAVVEHQRNLRFPGHERKCGAQLHFVIVLDGDEPEEPAVGLRGRPAVRVRVIPVETGAVAHGECVIEVAVGADQRLAVAVVGGVHGEAVPMRHRRLVEAILEPYRHVRAGTRRPGWDRHSRAHRRAPRRRALRRDRRRRRGATTGRPPAARRPIRPSLPGTSSGVSKAPGVAQSSGAAGFRAAGVNPATAAPAPKSGQGAKQPSAADERTGHAADRAVSKRDGRSNAESRDGAFSGSRRPTAAYRPGSRRSSCWSRCRSRRPRSIDRRRRRASGRPA